MQHETSERPSASVVRARYIFSDFHLGQGRRPDGTWHPMEDFRSDAEFAAMLRHVDGLHAPDVAVELHANGDVLDFMAMPYRGRFGAVPTEEAALAKFRAIADGHRGFFDGLRSFLMRRPGSELVVTIGNHDQDLAWPAVQDAVRAAVAAPDDRHRVRFVREERVGPVDIQHGDQLDAINAIPPKGDMFITDQQGGSILLVALLTVALTHGTLLSLVSQPRLLLSADALVLSLLGSVALLVLIGWAWGKLYFSEWAVAWRSRRGGPEAARPKFLNLPYVYYMNAGLGMKLKRRFMPDMGRVQDHGAVWILTVARSPYWAPILWIYLWVDILFHMFLVDRLSVRRKANLKTIWKILRSTMSADAVDAELERYAKEHPEVRYLVTGHTHQLGIKSYTIGDRSVLYLNPGTWIDQRDLVLPDVRTATRFPRLEAFFRRVPLYWKRSPGAALAVLAVHASAAALPFLAASVFGWSAGFWSWLAPPLSLFLMLWRFSYTEHLGPSFTKRTVVALTERADGEVQLRLAEYHPPAVGDAGTGRFTDAF